MDFPSTWYLHCDVIKWKHFPRYWPFVWGIHREFPSQRPVTRSFDVFFHLWQKKRLSKQSIRRCLETPSHSLWHHCNVKVRKGHHRHQRRIRQQQKHYSDIKWVAWDLKLPANEVFVQQLVPTETKHYSSTLLTICLEISTVIDNPAQRVSKVEKYFHITTSSCTLRDMTQATVWLESSQSVECWWININQSINRSYDR